MKPFELTEENKKAFDVFGFLRFPGLLADKAEAIIDAFERVWSQRGGGHAGKPHAGQARSCIFPFIDQSEYLSGLLEDPAIDSILTGLLGPDYNYVGSDGNYYAGDTSWHSDGWHKARHYLFAKVAFYLDPLTRDTGAVRFIPGSHRSDDYGQRVEEQIGNSIKNWGMAPNEVPSLAMESMPGDVVVFNHNLKHSAFGGGKARRMFTINTCQRMAPDDVPMLKSYIGNHARFWNDHLYGPAMMAGPDRRKIHLEQVLANEDHLPALAAKARREMAEPARG
jgi:Phytanoyl-CoA dioxygenase (PhyH)